MRTRPIRVACITDDKSACGLLALTVSAQPDMYVTQTLCVGEGMLTAELEELRPEVIVFYIGSRRDNHLAVLRDLSRALPGCPIIAVLAREGNFSREQILAAGAHDVETEEERVPAGIRKAVRRPGSDG